MDVSQEESVYNLIERAAEKVHKEKMYRSKYPWDTAPTGSTLCLQNTAKPGISNIAGCFSHEEKLKKRISVKTCRPPVPRKTEKPIMGLTTKKNFITSNAIDNILSVAKKPLDRDTNYLKKPDYGKVPEYLGKIKNEIQEEYSYINELQHRQQQQNGREMRMLSDEERQEILEALRERWNELNKKYQAMSFAIPAAKKNSTQYPSLDRTKVVKKESLESEMDEIEKDIQKFSKKHVFVFDDGQGYEYAQ